MKSDVEIAQAATIRPIQTIADGLGLAAEHVLPYGHDKAKISLEVMATPRPRTKPAKLILVSAITPTRAGEGKTTTSIGLAQAMTRLGESVCLALREPSLGPCMGVKGGACGGGFSQVIPMESINLHFTGDLHAITSAHNLVAAALDNHLHFGNALGLDPRRIAWRRVIDMNDRSLRNINVGLGGVSQGVPRETGFDITAASEVMAVLCLASDREDLRKRLDAMLLGTSYDKALVTVGQLNITGALMALLNEALMPNLVQTLEGTPALVHGGPFANIAHGCNSVIATKMAMHLSDYTVTEAGFGFDLGGEKFLDIKCQTTGLQPDAIVLVATVRALKLHGGIKYDDLKTPNAAAVERGSENLAQHIASAKAYGRSPIVAINRFSHDTEDELNVIRKLCEREGVAVELADHFAKGGAGAEDLARAVLLQLETPTGPVAFAYQLDDPLEDKIRKVAKRVYGADDVEFDGGVSRKLRNAEKNGFGGLPICIAKTQSSLSDDPKKLGRPTGFTVTIRDISISAGAGFVVVLTGQIMRMPGLPRKPSAENIDVLDGRITGLS